MARTTRSTTAAAAAAAAAPVAPDGPALSTRKTRNNAQPAPLEQELELPQSKNKGPGRGRVSAGQRGRYQIQIQKSKSKSTTKAKSAPEEEQSEDEASKGQASAKPELPSAEDDAGEGHSRKEGDNAFLRNAEEEEGKDVLQEEGDDVLIPNTKEEGGEDVFEEKEGEDVFMPNAEEEGGEDVFQEEGNDVFMRNAEAEGGEDVFREEGDVFMPNAEEAEAEGGDPFQENKVETAWVPPPPRSPARGERVTRSSPGRPRPAWHGGDARRLEFETTGDLDGWDPSRRRQRAPVDEDDEDEGLSGNPHLNNLSPGPRVQTRMHSARHNASRPSSPHAHPLASPRTPMNSRVRSPPAATPLPPSSPFRTSPPLESDADDSDDDYGRQQEEKRRLAAKRLARGFPSPPTVDTEEEDLEDEREFEASIALPAPKKRTAAANAKTVTRARPAAKKGKGKDKSGVVKESEPPSRQKKGKEKANAKGSDLDSDHTDPQPAKKSKRRTKQKKAAAPAEAYGVDSTDEGEDSDAEGEGEDAAGSKSGPVPQEIRDQLFAAQDAFHNKIAALAEKCGKDPQVLHQLLGTTPKMARNLTAWNTWQSWYSEHHPKSKEVDRTEYARISRQAFVDALPNLNKNELADSALVFETIPWLKKWHEETMANAINNWRDNGKFKSVVRKAIKPIIHQSRLFHSSLGVHLWGYVIDPNGEASFAFGGTDDFKAVRSENKFALSSFIKDLEHMFGMQEIKKRGLNPAHHILPKVLPQQEGEAKRDAQRRAFSTIMGAQLRKYVTTERASKFKMQWSDKFLDLAWESKIRIINYPEVLENSGQIIGGKFDLKQVKVTHYDDFLPDLEKANSLPLNAGEGKEDDDDDMVMRIVPWEDDDKTLSLDEQGDVGLVVATDGRCLRRVRHSPAFNKAVVAEGVKTAKKPRKDEGLRRPKEQARRAPAPPPPPASRPVAGPSRYRGDELPAPNNRTGETSQAGRHWYYLSPDPRYSREAEGIDQYPRDPSPRYTPSAPPRANAGRYSPPPRANATIRNSPPPRGDGTRYLPPAPSRANTAARHSPPPRAYSPPPPPRANAAARHSPPPRTYSPRAYSPPPRAYSPSPPPRANAGPRYPPESRGNAARYPPPLRAAPYARGEGGAVIHRRVKLEDQPGSSRSAALDERLALAPAAPRDRSSRTAALDQGAPAAPHAGSSRSAALDQRLALPVALPRPESSRSAALDQRAPPPHAGSSRDNRPQQGDRTAQTYPRLDLAERPPAPKRKHNDAGSLPTDRDAKRSRLQDDEALRPGQLDVYKLRFRVSSGVPKVFYATGFRRVGKWSRADMLLYYEFRHPDRGDVLVHIPKDSTPVFVSEQDRQRYESEISIHGLEDF
ncbi:hypothetical protein B0H11DRAFT_2259285 [Mycena galericulata]|nr:hypothetical protein B0H11DRAFT_2259285 [Mycena galericulata]